MYAVRIRILYMTPVMCRVRSKANPQRTVVMSQSEAVSFQALREKASRSVLEAVEKSEELSVANALDSLGCDAEVTRAILVTIGISFISRSAIINHCKFYRYVLIIVIIRISIAVFLQYY